jgi:hypothetical protein
VEFKIETMMGANITTRMMMKAILKKNMKRGLKLMQMDFKW